MKKSIIIIFVLVFYHYTFSQNNLLLFGKNIYHPVSGRFTYYPIGYNVLFSPPTTNVNYTRTFMQNQYWIELGYLDDIFPNQHLELEQTSSQNPDTLYIHNQKYYISIGKRLFSTKNENHSLYFGIGGIHRFKNTLTTIYGSTGGSFPEFMRENYSLLPSFGARLNLSYLFLYKFIALKSYAGVNYYPNYKDIQIETGIQLGCYVFDDNIKKWFVKMKKNR